jgi:hypothetical protein
MSADVANDTETDLVCPLTTCSSTDLGVHVMMGSAGAGNGVTSTMATATLNTAKIMAIKGTTRFFIWLDILVIPYFHYALTLPYRKRTVVDIAYRDTKNKKPLRHTRPQRALMDKPTIPGASQRHPGSIAPLRFTPEGTPYPFIIWDLPASISRGKSQLFLGFCLTGAKIPKALPIEDLTGF